MSLRYTVSMIFGITLSLVGLPFNQPGFWVVTGLFILYGVICNTEEKLRGNNGK
jgi:hypothetical protein